MNRKEAYLTNYDPAWDKVNDKTIWLFVGATTDKISHVCDKEKPVTLKCSVHRFPNHYYCAKCNRIFVAKDRDDEEDLLAVHVAPSTDHHGDEH